jgi:hypothetical protein
MRNTTNKDETRRRKTNGENRNPKASSQNPNFLVEGAPVWSDDVRLSSLGGDRDAKPFMGRERELRSGFRVQGLGFRV